MSVSPHLAKHVCAGVSEVVVAVAKVEDCADATADMAAMTARVNFIVESGTGLEGKNDRKG
jgi:hypothetical protein